MNKGLMIFVVAMALILAGLMVYLGYAMAYNDNAERFCESKGMYAVQNVNGTGAVCVEGIIP